MSASGSAANLVQSMKMVLNVWEQAKSSWHDSKSQEFDRHYIEPLPANVAGAITIMEEIDKLLNKIRSDCE